MIKMKAKDKEPRPFAIFSVFANKVLRVPVDQLLLQNALNTFSAQLRYGR
jgi:hypothetical protein